MDSFHCFILGTMPVSVNVSILNVAKIMFTKGSIFIYVFKGIEFVVFTDYDDMFDDEDLS